MIESELTQDALNAIVEAEYRRNDFLCAPVNGHDRFRAFPFPPWNADTHTHLLTVRAAVSDAWLLGRIINEWGAQHPSHIQVLAVPRDGIDDTAIGVLEAHGIRVLLLELEVALDVSA